MSPGRADRLEADAVLVVLTAVVVWPFQGAGLLALTDWPHHLASAAVLRDFADPARHLADHYLPALALRPYAGLTYVLLGLARVFDIETAGRVALSLYAVALVLAVRALVRSAPGRDPRLAWFGPLFVHGWALAYGLVPFVASLPFALFALAAARRCVDRVTPARSLGWGGAILAAAFFHPLGFGLATAASAPVALRLSRRARLGWAVGTGLVGLWVAVAGRLGPDGGRFMDVRIETAWRWRIKHKLMDYAVSYLPGDLDSAVAALGLGALVGLGALGARRALRDGLGPALRRADPLVHAALGVAVVYLVAPVNLAAFGLRVSLLSPRLIVPMWLCAIPAVAATGPRVRRWAGAGALAAVLQAGLLASTHRDFDATWGSTVRAAVAAIPVGDAVRPEVTRDVPPALNPGLVRPPQESLHIYGLLGRAGFDPGLFSTPQSPVRVRGEPPRYRAVWRQSGGRVRVDTVGVHP